MNITREADYAVRCILHLSKNTGRITVVDEIAQEMDIPKSFLAKILQKLGRAKLVKSTRGVKGGFQLAEDPANLTLLRVIESVQGPLALNICVIDLNSCSRSSFCSVHPIWVEVQDILARKLSEYTFDRLAREDKTPQPQKGRRQKTSASTTPPSA